MLNVVCAIIEKEDLIFLARRKKGKSMPGKWEFPGGKIEKKEEPEEALKRELHEELGMEVEILTELGESIHTYNDFTIRLVGYKCKYVSWTGKLEDHDLYQWLNPREVSKMDLAEADIPLLEKYLLTYYE